MDNDKKWKLFWYLLILIGVVVVGRIINARATYEIRPEIKPTSEASAVVVKTASVASKPRLAQDSGQKLWFTPWSGRVYGRKEPIDDVDIELVVEKLIECESGGANIEVIDTNGKYSRGILQFQDSSFYGWAKLAGLSGVSPLQPRDARLVARWALKNGLASHWTCSMLAGIIQ